MDGKKVFVHESAYIDANVVIGDGTTIWHFTHVQEGARIGRGCVLGQNVNIGPNVVVGDYCKIQNNVSVYAGVTLGDFVFCGPSMVFTNDLTPRCKNAPWDESQLRKTIVKEGASLGANCVIVCGNTIGKGAFVGAGSVVTRDVLDYQLVVGVPAKPKGWMCDCGGRIHEVSEKRICEQCATQYLQDRFGLVLFQRGAA